MKYCGKCGAQLEDNQTVCMKCGCAAAQKGDTAGSTVKAQSNTKLNKIIAAIVIIVIAILTGFYIYNQSDGGALVLRKFDSTISQAKKDGKFRELSFDFRLTGSPEVLDHTGDVYFVYSAAKTTTSIGSYNESSDNGLVFIIRIHSYLTGRCSMVSVVPVNGRPSQSYIDTWKNIYGSYSR